MIQRTIVTRYKMKLRKLYCFFRHYLALWYHHQFNPQVKNQLKDFKSIPIIIISFNQLFYLKQLIAFLLNHHYINVVILDNNSTYPPLLEYLNTIDAQVTVHRLEDNLGHLSFWNRSDIFKSYCKGYYVVTDADIVPIGECPDDFLLTFLILLDKAYDRTKVGFSLKLDTIPETNLNKANVLKWESQFWKTKIHLLAYKAEIDTTFALYRPGYTYKLKHFTKAWRTDYPLQAHHGGWYIDSLHLTEEQAYYMQTANASASWQINDQGTLINTKHQPLYGNES